MMRRLLAFCRYPPRVLPGVVAHIVSEQVMATHAKSKMAANLLRLGFIDFSFGFGFWFLRPCGVSFLAAAQMCFYWVKRKPRLKPAMFFIALLSAMPAVTRRSAAEVGYLKSAAATDPPRRIERLFFRFETLADSERDANWSTVRPAVSRRGTYLPQFESSAAYNLTR